MGPASWLPPVVWMALIMAASSRLGSGAETGRFLLPLLRWLLPWASPATVDTIHWLARKGGHVTEYAILAALWYRAFRGGRRATARASAGLALALSVAWAALDEWRQAFVPSRTASAADVALDGASAALALAVALVGWRAAADAVTRGLLWIALAGGAVALGANAWAGVSSGALWLTTPLAALVLLARRRLRR